MEKRFSYSGDSAIHANYSHRMTAHKMTAFSEPHALISAAAKRGPCRDVEVRIGNC